MHLKRIIVPLIAILLAGCAVTSISQAPPRPDKPWAAVTDTHGDVVFGKAAESTPSAATLPAVPALPAMPDTQKLEPDRIYGLADLIDVAASNNQNTRIAWNAARNAALAMGIARSTYLPRLTAAVVGGYASGSNTQTFAPNISLPSTASQTGTVAAVGLQWLLFDFGQRDAIVEAARETTFAANVMFNAAHQALIYDVAVAFYTHAAAAGRVSLLEQALANSRTVQAAAEGRLNQGQGTAIEVAQARQARAQANLRLVQARGAREDAYVTLLGAIGLPTSTHLRLADVSGRRLSRATAVMTDALIREAVSRRPDVQSAYALAKAGQAGVDAARAELMPKLFASGTVGGARGALGVSSLPSLGDLGSPILNLSNRTTSGVIMGGVSVPIYDGGVRYAMLEQARSRADTAQATLIRTRLDAARQIVKSDNALKTALATHEASRELSTAAATTFDAALTAFRSGYGSVVEMTLAQSGLLDAKLGETDAYHATLIAAASLAFATGLVANALP